VRTCFSTDEFFSTCTTRLSALKTACQVYLLHKAYLREPFSTVIPKSFNFNTSIRFAPHNVTPVTIESREGPHSNSTGPSSHCLGYFLATYFWRLQRIKISASKQLLQAQNHCRRHIRTKQQVWTSSDEATATRRPSSKGTRKTMPKDWIN
jgi:hypothetical protein